MQPKVVFVNKASQHFISVFRRLANPNRKSFKFENFERQATHFFGDRLVFFVGFLFPTTYLAVQDSDEIRIDVPADAQIGVYRIVQEGVSNSVRHASATEVEVRIRRDGQAVEIEIRDNGVGFELKAGGSGAGRPGAIGLANLQERVRALNGTVTIDSRPGHGTRLRVRLVPQGSLHAT